MNIEEHSLADIQHIRRMMERSSRFISLSGLSGVAAGVCAITGAWFGYNVIAESGPLSRDLKSAVPFQEVSFMDLMGSRLMVIAALTFMAAFFFAFMFTYLRSRKNNIPLWGTAARRLLWNVTIPMVAGGVYLFREVQLGHFGLIAPGCLIFYGLALVNASKYTLHEIRYLGYFQITLGILNCWLIGYGLYFWAFGFGVLHILYGLFMWNKYERTEALNEI